MKLSHIRGVDSVRAVGVALVVVYHLFTNVLPGGFLGVDVFFVISGFLVTGLFVREFKETGRVDLKQFYVRRVRRLFPAAGFMVAVTLSLSLLISPDLRVGMRGQVAAVFGWVTNYFEIASGQSYEDQFLPHLFVHTWTLGVEMHYYLIWGAVFCLVCLLYPKLCARAEALGRGMVSQRLLLFLCCAGIAAFSFVRMWLGLRGLDDPSPVYYATSTRIYPLMIGSALGLLMEMKIPKKRPPLLLMLPLLVLCLAAICFMARTFSFSDPRTYHFGILAASLLAAGSLYCLMTLQLKKFFVDPKPLAYLGKRSYSIYLFHWPLYHVFRQLALSAKGPFSENTPHIVYALLAVAAAVALAEVSYRVFEQPPISGRAKVEAGAGGSGGALRALDSGSAPGMTGTSGGAAAGVAMAAGSRGRRLRLRRAALIALCVCVGVSCYTLASVPERTGIERDYTHQQVLLNAGKMGQYGDYLAGLALDPVAFHGRAEQLPATPSEIAAGHDTVGDAQRTQDAAAAAAGRPDPAGPVAPIAPPGGANVTVFGDSVTLGAAEVIQQTLGSVVVDAKVSRNIAVGVDMINEYQGRGELGEYIVIALFTNVQNFTIDSTWVVLDAVPPGHRAILVTPYGKDYMEPVAEFLRTLPGSYPYVTVADWNAAIREHRDLLAPDGLHMNSDDSRQIYANLLAQAIEQAAGKPARE